jgi:hypothetical protein
MLLTTKPESSSYLYNLSGRSIVTLVSHLFADFLRGFITKILYPTLSLLLSYCFENTMSVHRVPHYVMFSNLFLFYLPQSLIFFLVPCFYECSSFRVSNHVSEPYKTSNRTVVSYILIFCMHYSNVSWDSSVLTVIGYRLDDLRLVSSRGRDFSHHHHMQTSSTDHSASYSMVPGVLSHG